MRLFHGTSKKNIESICTNGLEARFEGVYLTDSLDSAIRWASMRLMHNEDGSVIEVEVDEKHLVEGTDHSPMMVTLFGVGKSILSLKAIPKSRIKKVHIYDFNIETLKKNGIRS